MLSQDAEASADAEPGAGAAVASSERGTSSSDDEITAPPAKVGSSILLVSMTVVCRHVGATQFMWGKISTVNYCTGWEK